jgi:hypothetical protein
LASRGCQFPAYKVDVGKREECKHLRAVLLDASVADFAISELAFKHAKHMLDLGADRAVLLVERAL